MSEEKGTWLAARYHMPLTYSIRAPMTSANSAQALPAPSPATVRLALIRSGVELFGLEYVREVVYPSVRAAKVAVSPPEKVAFSIQSFHGYKIADGRDRGAIRESQLYREVAHAEGKMTVYLQVESALVDAYQELLGGIGYWGQTDSFTQFEGCSSEKPPRGEYAVPLMSLNASMCLKDYYREFASEFRDDQVRWEQIIGEGQTTKDVPIRVEVYVWPLLVAKRQSGNTVLVKHSFLER